MKNLLLILTLFVISCNPEDLSEIDVICNDVQVRSSIEEWQIKYNDTDDGNRLYFLESNGVPVPSKLHFCYVWHQKNSNINRYWNTSYPRKIMNHIGDAQVWVEISYCIYDEVSDSVESCPIKTIYYQ